MKSVLEKIRSIWAVKDVRSKILFTGLILLIYRLGAAVPVPYISSNVMQSFSQVYGGTILEYLNLLSGSALSQATVLALGISPYITASIVLQLLTVAIPPLQRMSKEEDGKKKIAQITRIVTVVLAIITAIAYYRILVGQRWLTPTDLPEWFRAIIIIACFTAGSSIVMWLGEKINEHGIGNGISMILFANILSRLPHIILGLWNLFLGFRDLFVKHKMYTAAATAVAAVIALVGIVAVIAIIALIIFITNSERRIPVVYSKRVIGRKMYGGQNTNLPLKLNMSGVMPIIFASSIVSLPATIFTLLGYSKNSEGFIGALLKTFEATSPLYIIIYIALIIAFSYFYILISFDPVEVSNNLKKNGGSVLGIRPGAPTTAYIKRILNRITFIGAIFLSIVAGLPLIINAIASAAKFTALSGIAFGGSSLLIVIGVALETYRAIEAQMSLRHYKGFLQ